MSWKRRTRRNVVFAALGGVAASALYWGLRYTDLHGFSIGMLGPAAELLDKHLDPKCYARSHCYLETLAVNAVLYAFWIMVALVAIDSLSQLKRKLAR
jgi:hypothetical protein